MFETYKIKLLLEILVLRRALNINDISALVMAWKFSGLSGSDKEKALDLSVQLASAGDRTRKQIYHVYSQRDVFGTAERRFNDYLKPFLEKASMCYLLKEYYLAIAQKARKELKVD
jgi:hypothetical protein